MSTASPRILFVDDEELLLEGIRRSLRNDPYEVSTALSAADALDTLGRDGPFAIVVSDFRMPKMDGVQFLTRVREQFPETVRFMLTGQADMAATVAAVNEGNIFRFLTKPCAPEALRVALQDGLEQYRLVQAERELLNRTLMGSIKILADLLSVVNPAAFSRAARIKRYVEQMVKRLAVPDAWSFRLAAIVSQIGCVALPVAINHKLEQGEALTPSEQETYDRHPAIAFNMLRNIPRLERVAAMVAKQLDPVPGDLLTTPVAKWDPAVLGGHMLAVASALDTMVSKEWSEADALEELSQQETVYARPVIRALRGDATAAKAENPVLAVTVAQLQEGMILVDAVYTKDHLLLVGRGQEVTDVVIHHLHQYARTDRVEEPLHVRKAPA